MDLFARLSAARPQFAFRIAGLPDNTLCVRGFTSEGHALSADYRFCIELLVSRPVDFTALLGKGCVLELSTGGDPVHGILASFEGKGQGADGPLVSVTLASPLHPLSLGRANRVFIGRSAPQILEEVARAAGIETRLSLSEDYPEREFTVQYAESDFTFLSRLAASWGIFFRFEQTKDAARLLFHDRTEELPLHGQILYREHSGAVRPEGTVFAFHSQTQLLPAAVEMRDYNYRTPETSLRIDAPADGGIPARGTESRYWENAKDLTELQRLARLRRQALDGGRETFIAESDCRALAPGMRFALTGHPDMRLNGEYLILGADHEGDQRAGFAGGEERGMGYKNTLRLVRAGTPWRPALPEQRRMHGTFTARIESPGGHYAHLDDEGRYRVRLDFDGGDAPESGASHPVRLLQPYGGQNWGMHFPLHAGTEVILACVGGDLDRPVILGALHNPATPSPVSSANPTQNIVRTWGGNELLMDDRQGKEKVELFTRERKNILTLDADEDGHNVRLATEEGEMEVFAAKTMLLESGDTHSVEAGNDHLITVENAQRLMTRKGEILQQAATDIRQSAAENIRMQAEQQDIELTAARDMIFDVGENCSVEVRQGDFTLITNNGQISIEAARAITIRGQGGGKIHIGQGGGQIEIAKDGSVHIDAPRVEIIGNSVVTQGGSAMFGGGGWSAPPSPAPAAQSPLAAATAPFAAAPAVVQPEKVAAAAATVAVAEILYRPGDGTFYALNSEELAELQAAARPLDEAADALDKAYAGRDEEKIAAAKARLDRTLAPLVEGAADTSTLTELIGFRGKKYTYVDSKKIKSHWRSYTIDGDMARRSLLDQSGDLNYKTLKDSFAKNTNARFTWGLVDPYSNTLGQWASGFNATLAQTMGAATNSDPERAFDLTPQAQIMRYAYGASAQGHLNLKKRSFGLSARNEVTLALAEGRADFNGYIPQADGYPLRFSYTVENGPQKGLVKDFDCGHIRLKGQAALTGFAGASLQASANVHFDIGKKGEVTLRGATKNDTSDDGKTGVGGEAFAGLKVGCEVSGAAEWQNPEKAKSWNLFAELGAGGEIALGGGGKGDFYISYENHRFRIRARAYLIWGFGGGGSFIFTVDVKNIAEFCMFVYHQLKNKDFSFIDFISEDAFQYFDTLRTYVLLGTEKLEAAYEEGEKHLRNMKRFVEEALISMREAEANQEEAKRLANRVLEYPDLVLFQPPEGKGRLLWALCHRRWDFPLLVSQVSPFPDLQERAILAVLRTVQTWNEYVEVMEHLTSDGRRIRPRPLGDMDDGAWREGQAVIEGFLRGASGLRFQYRRIRLFLERAHQLPRQARVHTAAVRDNGIIMS